MAIQNTIRKALLSAMYLSFLLFLMFFFVRVVVLVFGLPYLQWFGQKQLSMMMVLLSAICYLILILWSLFDIERKNKLSIYRKDILKKLLVAKPINGVTLYYFCTQGNSIQKWLTKNFVITFFFFVRKISFYLVFVSLVMLFVKHSDFVLALIASLVVITVFTHLLYELSVLTRIMEKSDDELVEYQDYFKAIQPPFAYSDFYYKEIRAERR